MTLRKVGFFFELPSQERINAIQSIRQEAPYTDEEKIVGYLESGAVYGAMPNVEEDMLSDPPQIIGPTRVQTDGVWAWPQTLTYYIHRYHIALPEEFVTHMRVRGWKCPPNLDTSQFTLEGEVSMD